MIGAGIAVECGDASTGEVIEEAATATSAKLASFAFDNNADAEALEVRGGLGGGVDPEVTDFKGNRKATEAIAQDVNIGGVGGVIPSEAATEGEDFGGRGGISHHPLDKVEFMWALIAQFATAGVPKPVPVVVKLFPVEGRWIVPRRAQPLGVVQSLGRGQGGGPPSDAVAFPVTQSPHG